MKKSVLFILFSSLVFLAEAQIRKIPADVTDAFAARYPHATKVEWKDKLQYFQASFVLNGSSITADFSSKGEWEGSERELSFDELPDEVKDGFQKSRYAERKKNGTYELQELGKPLQYRICVQKSGLEKKNLYFDTNGKLVKEVIAL
jgi:Putative beta-lactamase-inhibitor-like, PepSY-like